jgi:MFS family permease
VIRALRHRNYRLFLGGQLVSLVGTWMQSVAQSWLVYRLTGDPTMLGLVGFAGQFPVFLFAPVGGSLADVRDRHRIIVLAQAAMMALAFVLAGLTLGGWVRIWQVFVLASLMGLASAFDIPARQAFLIEMVGKEDLMNAIALNSSMVNGARIVGPALAGLVVAAVGEGWCFFVNGVSFLAVLGALLAMDRVPREQTQGGRATFGHVAEGFRYVAHTAPIRALLVLLGLISLTGMSYSVLMPVIVDRILHGGPKGLGFLMGCSGVGALLGALSLAARHGVRGLGRWITFASMGFGLSLIAFSTSRVFWLSAVLLVPAGYAMMVQMASSNTLIQAMVPDRLRGRVMAVYSMMFMGMAPFGALLAGVLARTLSAPIAVRIGGIACVLGSAVFALRWPDYRVEARRLVVAQEAGGGEPPDDRTGAAVEAS